MISGVSLVPSEYACCRISLLVGAYLVAVVFSWCVFRPYRHTPCALSIRSAPAVVASKISINKQSHTPLKYSQEKLFLFTYLSISLCFHSSDLLDFYQVNLCSSCALYFSRICCADFHQIITLPSRRILVYYDEARTYQGRILPLALCPLDRCRCHISIAIPRHDRIDILAHVQDQDMVLSSVCNWWLL